MGCWGLGQLNPKPNGDAPGFIGALILAGSLAVFLSHGLPLLNSIAIVKIHLYPQFISITRGFTSRYCRFPLILNYHFIQKSNGYILEIHSADQSRLSLVIPSEEIKPRLEIAFAKAKVASHGLPEEIIARRKELGAEFEVRVKSYRSTNRQREQRGLFWLLGVCVILLVLEFGVNFHFKGNPPVWLSLTLLVLFFGGLFLYAAVEGIHKKRLATQLGLRCPHCASFVLRSDFMQTLTHGHACGCCGNLFYSIPPADMSAAKK